MREQEGDNANECFMDAWRAKEMPILCGRDAETFKYLVWMPLKILMMLRLHYKLKKRNFNLELWPQCLQQI